MNYAHTDEQLSNLADCLLAHPNAVAALNLGNHSMADRTGVKLAQYLATSSTIQIMDLSCNHITEETYLAVAAALRVNTSLQYLHLQENQADPTRIDAAFVQVLRLNPDRPAGSVWELHSSEDNDFPRLKDLANQLGHPPLQQLLAWRC